MTKVNCLVKNGTFDMDNLIKETFNKNGKYPKSIKWKVDKNGCWICTSHGKSHGYPVISYRGKAILLSHYMYEQAHGLGSIGNLYVLHKCDNPACINPYHLEIGKQKENMRQMTERGRRIKGDKHPNSKLTKEMIRLIRASDTISNVEMGRICGVSHQAISKIRKGELWKEEL